LNNLSWLMTSYGSVTVVAAISCAMHIFITVVRSQCHETLPTSLKLGCLLFVTLTARDVRIIETHHNLTI
jgi:hypothetical protein